MTEHVPAETLLLESVFDREPAVVTRLRQAARATLGGDAVANTAELVISELVTNAVRYANGPHVLRVTQRAEDLLIEVDDGDAGGVDPGPSLDRNDGERGRGLRLVQALCSDFGVIDRGIAGKTVWASVAR